MKKTILIVFTLCLQAALSACGATAGEENMGTQPTAIPSVAVVPSTAITSTISDTSVPESTQVETKAEITVATETVPLVEDTLPTVQNIEATISEPASLGLSKGHIKDCYESHTLDDYLDYYLFVPDGATEDMPLVIYLHGDGDVGRMGNLLCNGVPLFAKRVYGERYPFLVLTPSTRTQSWIEGTIPGTLMELIEYIAEEYKVNKDKIIITGHSRGAIGVWYLINEYGDYFSAAVPVSCDSDIPEDHNYEMFAQVPIRAFVGTGDLDEKEIIEPMRSYIDATQQAGGDAELTIVQWATHSQTPERSFTKETFEWALTQ